MEAEKMYDQKEADIGKWYWSKDSKASTTAVVIVDIFQAAKRKSGKEPKKGDVIYKVKGTSDQEEFIVGTADRICIGLDSGDKPLDRVTNLIGT